MESIPTLQSGNRSASMKYLFLFLFTFSSFSMVAQCKAVKPFNEPAMEEIHDVYQFFFLHKEPQNKLDSLVLQVMHPAMVIDSNYFDWKHKPKQSTSVVDRILYSKLVHDIGKLRSPESFLILNLPYMIPFRMEDDLSPFTSFTATIECYGGAKALNDFFLHGEINPQLAKNEFQMEVIKKCQPLRNNYFQSIKYCQRLEGEEWMLYEMKQTNPAPYDEAIQSCIRKYLNNQSPKNDFFSKDSILLEVLQLATTHDAIWDDCVVKIQTANDSRVDRLGVIIAVGEDMFHQKKYIQRVYSVVHTLDKGAQLELEASFDLDFVSRIRRTCQDEN